MTVLEFSIVAGECQWNSCIQMNILNELCDILHTFRLILVKKMFIFSVPSLNDNFQVLRSTKFSKNLFSHFNIKSRDQLFLLLSLCQSVYLSVCFSVSLSVCQSFSLYQFCQPSRRLGDWTACTVFLQMGTTLNKDLVHCALQILIVLV